ncbi:hypothetical protein JX265_008033 [Neoarthrinium moseri]|uniref:Uncharacterized protein n=1 Tax=Neoarthrinium moseri TaxID=1658444 RepID=A0A9P9WIZ8_9PEZI|nr:uncharacterized protein JN550_004520 [Neoarthrinium moseri]KAI1849696.1 hypothetical protein JX266_004645 [Neoarthrinium moseri]KAI1865710.1 hypothetical protein JX265_008033 [Neoarthrinium moseri]KAI1871526.1 hypothetical protein JN550_004520 [Neoarthrinium moseri]
MKTFTTAFVSLLLASVAVADLPYNMPVGRGEQEKPHPPPVSIQTHPNGGHHTGPWHPPGTGGHHHPTGTGGHHHPTGTGGHHHPTGTGGYHPHHPGTFTGHGPRPTHVKEKEPHTFKTHTRTRPHHPHGTGPHGTGPHGTGSHGTGTGGGHHHHPTGKPTWHKPTKPVQPTVVAQ